MTSIPTDSALVSLLSRIENMFASLLLMLWDFTDQRQRKSTWMLSMYESLSKFTFVIYIYFPRWFLVSNKELELSLSLSHNISFKQNCKIFNLTGVDFIAANVMVDIWTLDVILSIGLFFFLFEGSRRRAL